jgi:hypothetical protein
LVSRRGTSAAHLTARIKHDRPDIAARMAAAMALYARQRDDKEMERWVKEIHLRACIRIGELSRELETARTGTVAGGPRGGFALPDGRKSKAEALAGAGISTSTAGRYEELTRRCPEIKPPQPRGRGLNRASRFQPIRRP